MVSGGGAGKSPKPTMLLCCQEKASGLPEALTACPTIFSPLPETAAAALQCPPKEFSPVIVPFSQRNACS
jgi:hypothetical protein